MSNLIGIFGGTFNPVHLGHLHVANELLDKLPLSEIRFLPCHTPVHRQKPSCTPEDRVNMLKLALSGHPKLTLDTHEIDREGPSFMIDTLKALNKEEPDNAFCLIIGSDAFAMLDTWKNWQDLTNYCHILVVNRQGYQEHSGPVSDFAKPRFSNDINELEKKSHGLVMHVAVEPSPISGSELRHAKRQGKSLENFLPKEVWEYIQAKGLY